MLSASTPIASPSVVIFNPSQIRTAYNFTSLFANYNANARAGQTIGIVDAYSNPNIFSDVDNFDSAFGLPGPASNFLSVVVQNGGTTLPSYDFGWAVEIALDVEWAHVLAPAAHIVLVEANSPTMNDLTAAVDQAVAQGASVVSMSWGASEFPYESTYDSHFNRPGVTFIAAAGDSGAGTEYPAVSP